MKARLITSAGVAIVGLVAVLLTSCAASGGSAVGQSAPAIGGFFPSSAGQSEAQLVRQVSVADSTVVPSGLQVVGTGVTRVRPDRATVTVGVQTRSANAADAQNQNNQQMQAVIDAIKAKGIPDANIQTTGLSLYPIVEGEQRTTSYVASNSVQVRVDDVGRVGELLDAAVAAGANQIGGVQFGIADEAAARQQAIAAAVQDARAKADALAQALGVSITGVEAVVEEGGGGPIVPVQMRAAAEADVAVEPGELEVRVQLRIVYRYQ